MPGFSWTWSMVSLEVWVPHNEARHEKKGPSSPKVTATNGASAILEFTQVMVLWIFRTNQAEWIIIIVT